MRKRKLRIAPLLFAVVFVFLEMVGCLCVPDREEIAKATGAEVVITAELAEQLLLKLAGKMAKNYVEDIVSDRIQNELGIDPAPVVSSGHFVRWDEPDRVKAYIVENGSQRLAETWYDLNKQFLNTNGVVDKEYYVAFYRALINDITDSTNDVLDEINNDYVNTLYHFNNLSDDLRQACLTYPIYMIMIKRNNDGSISSRSKPVMFFLNDIYYGIPNSYTCIDGMYLYHMLFGDIAGYSPDGPAFRFYPFSGSATFVYFISSVINSEKIDFNQYYNCKDMRVKCNTYPLYCPELAQYGCASGYEVMNVGLTPRGHVMYNKGVDDDYLRKTLNMCKNSTI